MEVVILLGITIAHDRLYTYCDSEKAFRKMTEQDRRNCYALRRFLNSLEILLHNIQYRM